MVVEGDDDQPMAPASAPSSAPSLRELPVASGVAENNAGTFIADAAAFSASQGHGSDAPAGSWSIVDEARGCLRPGLQWVPSPGQHSSAMCDTSDEPSPPAAMRAVGSALHGLLSADLAEKRQQRHALGDTQRFYPSSLAVLLTRPDLGQIAGVGVAEADALASATSQVMLGEARGSASALSSGSRAPQSVAGRLYVIVEKNFRVYAYTRDELHVALVALFCKVRTGSTTFLFHTAQLVSSLLINRWRSASQTYLSRRCLGAASSRRCKRA